MEEINPELEELNDKPWWTGTPSGQFFVYIAYQIVRGKVRIWSGTKYCGSDFFPTK